MKLTKYGRTYIVEMGRDTMFYFKSREHAQEFIDYGWICHE